MRTNLYLTLAALLLATAACPGSPGSGPVGGPGGTRDASAPRPRAFVYARGSDAVTLDPQKVTDGESVLIAGNIFDSLVRYGTGRDIVPALATSWARAEDGLSWTLKLREGVVFHDGEPFAAEAVVFTFERLLKDDHPFHDAEIKNQGLYRDIAKVEALGPHEVRFTLKRPLAPGLFLGSLTVYSAFIVSPKGLAAAGNEGFGQRPIGTGPYKLADWKRDQRIVLERFDRAWEPAKTSPIVVLTIGENAARRQQLEAGEVHTASGLSPIDIGPLAKAPGVRVVEEPGMAVGYLALNVSRPKLKDVRVRQAIAAAIDRKRLVDLNFQGHASAAAQVTPPTALPVPDGLTVPAPDRETAKRLLKEAGLEGGLELELWAMPNPRPYMPEPKKTAELLKDDLAAVGIRVTIVTYPWAQYLEKTQKGEHDMCLLGWTLDVMDPDNTLFTFFAKESLDGTNVSFFEDPEFDALLARAQALGDEAERTRIYHDLEARVRTLVPMVPLVHPTQLAAERTGVSGLTLHPTGRVLFAPVTLEPAGK